MTSAEHWTTRFLEISRIRAASQPPERPENIPARLRRLGVPSRAIAALASPQARPALLAARAFLASASQLLLLAGPPGIGKTTAAVAVAAEECLRKPSARPTGVPEPVAWLQAARLTRISAYGQEDASLCHELRGAKLLVVDDLGDEGTPLGISVLVELVKLRERPGQRTVLTSNLRPSEFRHRYGPGVADRINAAGQQPNFWGDTNTR